MKVRPLRKGRPSRRADDDDDWTFIYPSFEVEDEDECLATLSPIIDPATGHRIVHEYASEKQGFLGFVKPTWADDNYEPEEEVEDDAESCQSAS